MLNFKNDIFRKREEKKTLNSSGYRASLNWSLLKNLEFKRNLRARLTK